VPHVLQGAGDLALQALLDGDGERHEGGLSYRRLRSRDSAPGIRRTTASSVTSLLENKFALLLPTHRQRPLQRLQYHTLIRSPRQVASPMQEPAAVGDENAGAPLY
jgi:hypothetical protein